MRILVLTSRYTATRDIISEDFGRQTRLFSALRRLGHEIDFFCADYRKRERRDVQLHGMAIAIRPLSLTGIPSFLLSLHRQLARGKYGRKYDLLIATSDPLWGVLGLPAARM